MLQVLTGKKLRKNKETEFLSPFYYDGSIDCCDDIQVEYQTQPDGEFLTVELHRSEDSTDFKVLKSKDFNL